MKTLETERLILRNWRYTDLESLYNYAKDPDVGPMAGWAPHASIEVSETILKHFMSSGEVWAIEYKENGHVIGSIGLHPDEKRRPIDTRMIGYVIGKSYWGKGLVVEAVKEVLNYAFNDLALALVSIYHFPHNHQSKRVIEKCGFTYEGTLKMATEIFDGTVYDDVSYSMTREDYINWRLR